MSMIQSDLLLGQEGGAGYAISRSLRFNSSDSAFLSRTPASAGNRKTWTWAAWVKRSGLGTNQTLLCSVTANGQSTNFTLIFGTGDKLGVEYGTNFWLQTTQVFRDTSAWFHLQLAVDTTQATASERMKLWVNGAQITAFDTNSPPAQNTDLAINRTELHTIGSLNTGLYFSGLLADVFFIDGQALTPSSFAETNATTGQWVPKAYTGSYGTNGFRLDFSDNSAATATTLGKDRAGSNNWTPNNLSVTAGAGNDSLVDTPTSYGTDTGAGGEVRGNYATLNPLDKGSNAALTNGNLDVASTTQSWSGSGVRGTIGLATGKWYWEITCLTNVSGSANIHLGIATVAASLNNYLGADAAGWAYTGFGAKYNNNSGSSYGVSNWVSGAVVGVALDLDNGTLTFYHNGVSQGQAYSGLTGSTYFPAISVYNASAVFNAGQRPFAYTAPSGFKALCDQSLPAPVVANPSTVMNVVLYNGNSSNQSITSLGFSPDLVWGKSRNTNYFNTLQDTVRGAGQKILYSNSTDAENAYSQSWIDSFDSNGFTMPTGFYNQSGYTYVAWCWDAGSSTVTNTQGSITSQVRANASAGFSIVTFNSGSAGNYTVGHGLNIAPAFIVSKDRTNSSNWTIFQSSLSSANSTFLSLNLTNAAATGTNIWGTALPTSTVFGFQSNGNQAANANIVCYCFAPVAGYSSFGSYTGNGSADGPFVYTGFRPRWVMFKRTDSTGNWVILNTASSAYNVADKYLMPNSSQVEDTAAILDIVSNGFKLRYDNVTGNANGGTYMWAAFAESPFQYARAR